MPGFFKRILYPISLGMFLGFAGWQSTVYGAPATTLEEDEQISIITKLTGALLSNNHYRQQKLDDNQSSKVFDEYFKLLDPAKLYFTAPDIAGFEKYRYYLDDLTRAGNADFAFEVYDLLLKRMTEYQEFAEQELTNGFDFTLDETIEIDRQNAKPFANAEEQREFWRKKLKNDVLYFRLLKRAMESETPEDAAEADRKAIQALWDKQTPEEKILKRLRDIHNEMSQKDKMEILGFYLTAMALTYGPHSSYFSPREEEDFSIDMSLSLYGIGATLTSDDGYTKVVEIVPGGPAALEGTLKAEDRIIAVSQQDEAPVDVIDMSVSKVVKLIRGPENTKVTLTVLSGSKGRNAIPENITITRGKVELKESEASGSIRAIPMPDGQEHKIGVINLNRFYMDFEAAFRGDKNYKSCTRDVKRILEDFKKEGVDGVIVDMRLNGGGSLQEAISLSGLFITSGPVVQVRNSERKVKVERDPDDAIVYDGPLMVLTSKLTSSAAEIFTGAIKDYQRGIVVGDSRTYGKGTVLDVTQLDRLLGHLRQSFPAGSLKYETAIYYRINGESTQQLGIKPDIQLPSFTEFMEVGELYNENHLPWDSIAAVPHDNYDSRLAKEVKILDEKSRERRQNDSNFQKYQAKVDLFKSLKERKVISLNEETRFKEYQQEKELDKENDALNGAAAGEQDNKKKQDDWVMEESVRIMSDFIDLKAGEDAA